MPCRRAAQFAGLFGTIGAIYYVTAVLPAILNAPNRESHLKPYGNMPHPFMKKSTNIISTGFSSK
jgi:hypothetical protein